MLSRRTVLMSTSAALAASPLAAVAAPAEGARLTALLDAFFQEQLQREPEQATDLVVGLAAACGAVLIAAQLGIDHWFYLYIPWFFPVVLVALLGRYEGPVRRGEEWGEASGSARSSRLAVAASS